MVRKFDKPILVTKSFLPPLGEYIEQCKKIWDSHWLTNDGELCKKFVAESQNYLKVSNMVPFVNGHLALEIAIKALGLKGNVITTPFTFASTTHALINNGLEPRFCDINLNDFTIDSDIIEALIDENTSAILPVHVFGNPCDVAKINKISQNYSLKVIYDAAHVFGVEIDGVGIGNFGDVSMFSLHATKVFHSIEGGLLTFHDKDLERQFNLYKNFGITGPETVEAVGLNAKMNEFQAAMGLVNLRYIDDEIAARKLLAECYRDNLCDIEGINYLNDTAGVKHNYAYFPIIIDPQFFGITRNQLHEKLKEFNIYTRKYFYPLTTDYECYKNKYKADHLINSICISDKILTLPIYGTLTLENVFNICEIIKILKNTK